MHEWCTKKRCVSLTMSGTETKPKPRRSLKLEHWPIIFFFIFVWSVQKINGRVLLGPLDAQVFKLYMLTCKYYDAGLFLL